MFIGGDTGLTPEGRAELIQKNKETPSRAIVNSRATPAKSAAKSIRKSQKRKWTRANDEDESEDEHLHQKSRSRSRLAPPETAHGQRRYTRSQAKLEIEFITDTGCEPIQSGAPSSIASTRPSNTASQSEAPTTTSYAHLSNIHLGSEARPSHAAIYSDIPFATALCRPSNIRSRNADPFASLHVRVRPSNVGPRSITALARPTIPSPEVIPPLHTPSAIQMAENLLQAAQDCVTSSSPDSVLANCPSSSRAGNLDSYGVELLLRAAAAIVDRESLSQDAQARSPLIISSDESELHTEASLELVEGGTGSQGSMTVQATTQLPLTAGPQNLTTMLTMPLLSHPAPVAHFPAEPLSDVVDEDATESEPEDVKVRRAVSLRDLARTPFEGLHRRR